MAYSRIKDLMQKRADLTNEMDAMLAQLGEEDREFTPDEEKLFAEKKAARARADKLLTYEQEQQLAEMQLSAPTGTVLTVPDGARISVGEPPKFPGLGAMLQAVAQFSLTKGRAFDPRLAPYAAATGMNETVGSEGGFLVDKEWAAGIITPMHSMGQLLSRVRKVPLGAKSKGIRIRTVDETSRANGSRWGGVQAYWVDEAGNITATKPKFGVFELSLAKIAALYYATSELMEDAVALEAIVRPAITEELVFQTEDAIFEGTGAGMPLGIMRAGCLITVNKESGQPAGTIVYENISNMWARLWPGSQSNAVWFVNLECLPQLNAMTIGVGAAGQPVYLPPGGVSQSPYATLMGRPVIPLEYCSAVGTVGDIVLADMSGYLMIDKDVRTDSSIHVAFLTDEVAFRFIYRVDGKPQWKSPMTPFKGTKTLSPFIALQTRG